MKFTRRFYSDISNVNNQTEYTLYYKHVDWFTANETCNMIGQKLAGNRFPGESKASVQSDVSIIYSYRTVATFNPCPRIILQQSRM